MLNKVCIILNASSNKQNSNVKQTKSTESSAYFSIQLSKMIANRLMERETANIYFGFDGAIAIIDNNLWVGVYYSIDIYNMKLKKMRNIALEYIKQVSGLAEVHDDKVALSSDIGLFIMTKKGICIHLKLIYF